MTLIIRGNKSNKHGFTLIELLVVTLILSVIISVIAACLSGGIRAWDNARNFNRIEAEAFTGLRMLETDLMNSFRFYQISFNGNSKQVSFPLMVIPMQRRIEGKDARKQIGTVEYLFNPEKQILFRKGWKYPLTESPDDYAEPVIANLNNISFQYYNWSENKKIGQWEEEWNSKTNFPNAVRIELFFKNNSKVITVDRTIFISIRNDG